MKVAFDADDLGPLVEAVVSKVLARVETARARLDDRLAYSEAEAARLLGLKPHQLRDARLRHEVTASKIAGRRIRYTRDDLLRYLASNRWQ